MSKYFNKLDQNFDWVKIYISQRSDNYHCKMTFVQLKIRQPDYILNTGINSQTQYEQFSYLSKELIDLLKSRRLNPDLILFLGDSHSVMVSAPLFKEGYTIGHIEGGMRSYDRGMPEEFNRIIVDYMLDYFFFIRYYVNEYLIENVNKQ